MKRLLKTLALLAGGIVVVVLLLIGALYLNAVRQTSARFNNPVSDLKVTANPTTLARGEQLVSTIPGCVGCHSSDRSPRAKPVLDGGVVEDAAALGYFSAPNLTPGGRLKDWTDGEILRAIREGIGKDGRPLLVMPSGDFRNLGDDDAQAIIAYLRSMPAVQRELPPLQPSLLGYLLLGAGQLTLSNQAPVGSVRAPAVAPNADYGKYLVSIGGCTACHGPKLDGKDSIPGLQPGPDLAVVKAWTEEQFLATLRTGKDPAGKDLNPVVMPWREIGRAPETELKALYQYLRGR